MTSISAPVGQGGANKLGDVKIVQALLNNFVTRLNLKTLIVDGDPGADTRKAIRSFQGDIMGIANPDGRIDPGGRTLARLSQSGATIATQPAPAQDQMSGAAWWHANQAHFENSRSLLDLAPPFRENVTRFIQAMRDGGATVSISATRRNKIRAYLMHFSFRLGKGEVQAATIPPEPGCAIHWVHGSEAASRAAAKEMSDLFGIAFQPSLTSLHIQARAVDMTISWPGTLSITDAGGHLQTVDAPRNGGNAKLQGIGRGFGAIKLVTDPPHWSDNGH